MLLEKACHTTVMLLEKACHTTVMLLEKACQTTVMLLEKACQTTDVIGEGLPYNSDVIGEGLPYNSDVTGEGLPYNSDVIGEGLPYNSDVIGEGIPCKWSISMHSYCLQCLLPLFAGLISFESQAQLSLPELHSIAGLVVKSEKWNGKPLNGMCQCSASTFKDSCVYICMLPWTCRNQGK